MTVKILFRISFHLQDAHLRGFQDFEVENFDLRILGLSLQFDFAFKRLVVDGHHKTSGKFAGLPVSGEGDIELIFNDVIISGVVQLNTINDGKLNLETLHVGLQVGSVKSHLKGFGFFVDPVVNGAIEGALPTLLNESERIVDFLFDALVIPANLALNQIKLPDLLIVIIDYINSLDGKNAIV